MVDKNTNTSRQNQNKEMQDITNYRAGMYLFEGQIKFGSSHRPKPVVLVLENGRLTMTGDDAEIFSVPMSSVKVEFTRLSNMYVIVNGVRYLLGVQKEGGKPFTKKQIELLHDDNQGSNRAVGGAGTALAGSAVASVNPSSAMGAAGGVAAGIGLAAGVMALHDIDKVINAWEYAFANNGVHFTKRIHHAARNFLIFLGITFLIFVIIAIIGSKMSQTT